MAPIFMRSGLRARLLLSLLLLTLLVLPNRIAAPSNYSCGNPSSGHCYGVATWQEQPQYFGSYVDLLQIAMNCASGCGGFLNNEMWLVDNQTQGCVNNQYGQCWVEAGFQAQDGGGNPIWFWADSRPLQSNTYNNHFLNQADSGDFEHFMIIKDSRNGAQGVFQVWIYNDSLSVLFQGTSTNNNISPNIIHIGTELAGTNGASSALAQFSRNIWAVKPLGADYTFWYNRQTDEGSLINQNPPSASWLINPNLPPPPEGGMFTTNCCN
jgi:hypothetical protein